MENINVKHMKDEIAKKLMPLVDEWQREEKAKMRKSAIEEKRYKEQMIHSDKKKVEKLSVNS